MDSIVRFEPDFIFKFKSLIKIDDSVREKFEDIATLMTNSTDKKKFKVKANTDINLNDSKWYRKRFITDKEKSIKLINSLLNKLTNKNYIELTESIIKIKINSSEMMDYFVKNMIEKMRIEHHYIDNWEHLLVKTLFNNVNKWKFDKYLYQKVLDYCQDEFEKIINQNYHENLSKLYNDDIDSFYKIKKKNAGLMYIICILYKEKLISDDILNNILDTLTKNYELYYKVELGVSMIKYLNQKKLIDLSKYDIIDTLISKKELNVKVKFMIYDIIENRNESNSKNLFNSNDEISNEKIKLSLGNLINKYLYDSDLNEFITELKDIKIKPKSNILIFSWLMIILDQANINNIYFNIDLIKRLLKKRILKFNTIKYGLIEFLNEYDDLKFDYPKLDIILESIFLNSKKVKLLSNDNIKFILSKSKLTNKLNF